MATFFASKLLLSFFLATFIFSSFTEAYGGSDEQRNLKDSAVKNNVIAEVLAVIDAINKEANKKGIQLKLSEVLDSFQLVSDLEKSVKIIIFKTYCILFFQDSLIGSDLFNATVQATNVLLNRPVKVALKYSRAVYPDAPVELESWNVVN